MDRSKKHIATIILIAYLVAGSFGGFGPFVICDEGGSQHVETVFNRCCSSEYSHTHCEDHTTPKGDVSTRVLVTAMAPFCCEDSVLSALDQQPTLRTKTVIPLQPDYHTSSAVPATCAMHFLYLAWLQPHAVPDVPGALGPVVLLC